MDDRNATWREKRRTPKPLDRNSLRDLALAYVARFATSSGKLEAYLVRKLRERGWAGEGESDVPALVADFAARGFVDDRIYGSSRTSGLLARGYGLRWIEQDLRAAGIEEDVRHDLMPGEGEIREAALALARKRRFGPFGIIPEEDETAELRVKRREKQLAAMVRAGHDFAIARRVIEAGSIEELEEWLASVEISE